ncbi:hypothetical protein, unlikely [Trypanosoma brucei gambiense DAL972]|uniref:Uncharacterized protein n=1 Tax=Trypanosoma brucei gambiense (strain MHOM/CI/86/DAL972) TaxID=679716 RepID=C9ZU37_TRYB9|nr:hypothetical protein, unlikely [Trypanosoma brucei gambiense DAL972]CBH12923.1 hypothetical protein, unlikely [Trypanosoma brucei gambiense DAL972]|eukprot:XP_011775202.1 hypothetical protein, unlikely [Trypanosoma brucei gambiense DAL972]
MPGCPPPTNLFSIKRGWRQRMSQVSRASRLVVKNKVCSNLECIQKTIAERIQTPTPPVPKIMADHTKCTRTHTVNLQVNFVINRVPSCKYQRKCGAGNFNLQYEFLFKTSHLRSCEVQLPVE